jgi:hypothetical protein
MTHGTNVNNLYVFLSHHKKIATIRIPVGSDTEISFTYESSWVEEGYTNRQVQDISGAGASAVTLWK